MKIMSIFYLSQTCQKLLCKLFFFVAVCRSSAHYYVNSQFQVAFFVISLCSQKKVASNFCLLLVHSLWCVLWHQSSSLPWRSIKCVENLCAICFHISSAKKLSLNARFVQVSSTERIISYVNSITFFSSSLILYDDHQVMIF